MFDVGFSEIIVIFGLALLVLGPEKLPGLVQKLGRWTGRARAMARQLQAQLEQEVTLEELARSKPTNRPAPKPSEPAQPAASPEAATVDSQSEDVDTSPQAMHAATEAQVDEPARDKALG